MSGLHWCGHTFMDHRPFFRIFETSKNHILAEIFAMVEISVKIFRGKKTYAPSFYLL